MLQFYGLCPTLEICWSCMQCVCVCVCVSVCVCVVVNRCTYTGLLCCFVHHDESHVCVDQVVYNFVANSKSVMEVITVHSVHCNSGVV